MTIPDDVVLYSPMLEQSLGALEPGQTRTFKTLDPASMGVSDVRVRADRRETITIRGKPQEAVVLAADYQGMTLWTWINSQGELLRQDTPLGWSMEACEAEDALAYKKSGARQPEALAAAAAPADKPLEEPRRVRRLELVLKGIEGEDPAALASPRQTVLESTTNGIRLVIEALDFPPAPPPGAPSPLSFTNDLAATAFIQSDDPALIAKASAVTKGLSGAADKAKAINAWVYRNVRKNPAASLPSALAVLSQMEGDCNEHTYLAVALCRAAGVPARVKAGVVSMNNLFYYHAWVAVHVNGTWVEMDPTFGQPVADATHVALTEGELGGQARLMRYLGRLSVSILKAEKEPSP